MIWTKRHGIQGEEIGAQLVIIPQIVRTTALIPPESHYQAVWDITSETPELVQYVFDEGSASPPGR